MHSHDLSAGDAGHSAVGSGVRMGWDRLSEQLGAGGQSESAQLEPFRNLRRIIYLIAGKLDLQATRLR